MRTRSLQVVPGAHADRLAGELSPGGDLALIGFLLAVHVVLLGGFFLGVGWGDAVAGYATAVVILAGREFIRELARSVWNREERRR